MTSLEVIRDDITTLDVDVIVNAANSSLLGGGGVDGAIHRAGGPIILEQCRKWRAANGSLPTGEVMVTDAGAMPSRHVIHTVGPVWGARDHDESGRLLATCYRNSLDLASNLGAVSIAFPCVSTGVYGFPRPDAAAVAVETVTGWVEKDTSLQRIVFVCFDEENLAIYTDLLGSGWPAGMEEDATGRPD